MTDLPELGVGIVYSPGLEQVLEAGRDIIDVIEIEPQTFWFKESSSSSTYLLDKNAFDKFGEYPQRKIVHGVGFAIGGTISPEVEQLQPFIDSIEKLSSPWASEHLSFNKVGGVKGVQSTGFLLPPLQSKRTVELAAINIQQLKRELPVPFAFETGVSYLSYQAGEMTDGAFFANVAETADCGILLDLHNLWANARNGRQTVLDTIAEMPLERVWEVHLAGGDLLNGYWLDAHSGLVPPQLMDLAGEIFPRLPNLKAVVFEMIEDYLTVKGLKTDDILDQMLQIRTLWENRHHSEMNHEPAHRDNTSCPNINPIEISPFEWEQALCNLVIGRTPFSPLEKTLDADKGIPIYQELVTSVRGGMIVSLLTLTYRFLVLSIGKTPVMNLLSAFWATTHPEQFASVEIRNFAKYLRAQSLELPNLYDVLKFEIATQDAILHNTAQTVRFRCNPLPLLQELGAGYLPKDIEPGDYELTIDPSGSQEVTEHPE